MSDSHENPTRQFPDAAGPPDPAQPVAVFRADQRQRWRRGERVSAEEYLSQDPSLRADPEGALELVYAEFLLREELGEAKKVGPLVDVWALGAVLYELLTGRPPFLADTVVDAGKIPPEEGARP